MNEFLVVVFIANEFRLLISDYWVTILDLNANKSRLIDSRRIFIYLYYICTYMSISIFFNCQAVRFRQLSFNVQIPGTEVLRFIIIVL